MIVSTSRPRAACKSLLAGLDMDMMSEAFAAHMVELVTGAARRVRARQQELLDDVAATGQAAGLRVDVRRASWVSTDLICAVSWSQALSSFG